MASSKSDVATNTNANRCLNLQRMQNVVLVWLDSSIDDNNDDCNNTIKQLKHVVNNVNTFTDDKQCIEFIQTIANNKVCLIVSGSLGQHIVLHVHDMSQVDTIFVFCNNQKWHEQWAKEWPKIKGVFTDIIPICEALKQTAHQCEQNATSISFVTSNMKLDQLDPSFMYTQILKEILLTINFVGEHINDYIQYCRDAFVDNEYESRKITKLERHYHDQTPIWWYTYPCFLYPMLNHGLRLMDVDIIVRMGFFINDLHRDIQRLHWEQFDDDSSDKIFTVYRGQGLSKEDFTEMTKTKGGLLSFNNFLSTSKNRDVSLKFTRQAATNPDLVGILFVMSINSTRSTTPFASISDISYFQTEDEVLFSMHTIFRIEDIKLMDENNHLYQVNLALTDDNDEGLRSLTDRLRQETFPDVEGWDRLGLLLIKMGQFTKAEEVYEVLLHQTRHESNKAPIYHQLGMIKRNQGEYQEALIYYNKSLAIDQKTLPSNHFKLASCYNNIGNVYKNMHDYPKALLFHEKALTIRQQSLPFDHPDLGASYNNIGSVYYSMGDYPKALSFYEKDLVIGQQSLPSNYPGLGASYNNIGLVYSKMGDYSKALLSHETALAIQEQSLPSNHPNLGSTYNNIGLVYDSMGDYLKALSYYEKDLAFQQQTLPSNHPDLATSYNNIGMVYYNMGDHSKAFSYYEKALAIRQQSLPSNHPDLACSYMGIGNVYYSMSDYPKALSYFEKALVIRQQSLPCNHLDLGASYNNIGNVYRKMSDYPKALSYFEKALAIQEQSLPSNHPNLGSTYNNIGLVYDSMGDYLKALSYYGKDLAIGQQSLPFNHPDLYTSYNDIGAVYENMGNYSKAHSFYERAVQNGQQSLSSNHPTLQQLRKNLEDIKKKL
ncbi:unnamed protein product [Adineta steineri]|uniref:ADP ribosyltransferase domain-containing protein n=2 Tax=Adineta steineri TaxID=433720 RepID=A0A819D1R0_9BILA|nr:unnamed protein product [Adineta steineri]